LDNRKAFSVMELLVVLTIFMVVVVEVSSFSSRWYLQNSLDSTKNMLVSSIQKAQNYAISKKGNLTWGVCLTGGTLRMFGGSCASPTIKDDYTVPSNVTMSGLSTVTFSTFRGEPSSAQSITLSGNNKTYTVTVNLAGGLDVN
jgi:Tfp pilus assembly protein FimT